MWKLLRFDTMVILSVDLDTNFRINFINEFSHRRKCWIIVSDTIILLIVVLPPQSMKD